MSNDNRGAIDLQKLLNEIEMYAKEKRFSYLHTDDNKNGFEQISLRLSSLLPRLSDPSLSEIDDLTMPCNIQPTASLAEISGKTFESILKTSLNLFIDHLVIIEEITPIRSVNPILFSTLIQLIEQCPEKDFDSEKKEKVELRCHSLSKSENLTYVCLALKMMKVAIAKHKVTFRERGIKYCESPFVIKYLWKLKNTPQAKSPEKKRITSWLTYQSSSILDYLNISTPDYLLELKFSTWKGDPESYICELERHFFIYDNFYVIVDHLFTYFMSAKDENEKLRRIEYFVKACSKSKETITDTKMLFKGKARPMCPLNFVTKLVQSFQFHLCGWSHHKLYPEDTWNEIEKYHGYSFEPYLTTKSINSGVPNCQPINEKFRESLELKSDEEPDFTVERYFYYDGFIKSLQVMSILNIVFLKSADILKLRKFPKQYKGMIFRREPQFNSIKSRIIEAIIDPSKRGILTRRIEIAMKICPFLFVSKNHEYLMKDMVKVLRGEQVDEAIIEELYFAMRNLPSYFVNTDTDTDTDRDSNYDSDQSED